MFELFEEPLNLKSQSLKKSSFSGKILDGADFSNTDIRGIDFSQASLIGCNFQYSHSGQLTMWLILIFAGSLFLAILTGFLAGFSGGFLGNFLFGEKFITSKFPDYIWVARLVSIAFVILPICILIIRGYVITLGILITLLIILFAIGFALAEAKAATNLIFLVFLLFVVISITLSVLTLLAVALLILWNKATIARVLLLNIFAFVSAFPGYLLTLGSSEKPEEFMLWHFKFGSTIIYMIIFLISANFIARKAIKGQDGFKIIQSMGHYISSIKGTNFQSCDLTDANFSHANLQAADLRQANLKRTSWLKATNIVGARVKGTYLESTRTLELVVTKKAQDKVFDGDDLQGLNLQGADLKSASFIGCNLSGTNLKEANLSQTKLVKTQLYQTNLNSANLTGAYIQDWVIATDTNLENIKCDYIYTRLPSKTDPDPGRKPDHKKENFAPGDFSDFIAPIIKTLNLYQQQFFDPRTLALNHKTLDLFHHKGIKPSAAALAIHEIMELYPEADIKLVAIESMGKKKTRLQAKIKADIDRSEVSEKYFENYEKFLSMKNTRRQSLLLGISEKNQEINQLKSMLETAIQQPRFYVETYAMDYVIDIFISYSSNDREWIIGLAAALQSDGYKVWWDKTLLPGQDYKNEIQRALDRAKCIIVAWSESSISSSWVKAEANQGFDRKVLIPLLYESVRVPVPFDSVHTADFKSWNNDKDSPQYQKLIEAIENKMDVTA